MTVRETTVGAAVSSMAGCREMPARLARSFGVPLLLPLLLCLVLCLAASSAAAAEPPVSSSGDDTVPTVANPAAAREGSDELALRELWRIGGEDDEENLLGVIGQAFSDDDGRVYLVDQQLTQVHIYAADGTYLESLGAQGEGPGEVRRLQGALLLPDGSLGLVQSFPGQIVKVDLDGTPAGILVPGRDDPTSGGFHGIMQVQYRGGRLAISGMHTSRDEGVMTRQHYIGGFDLDGRQLVTYRQQSTERQMQRREIDEKENYFPHRRWALGPDGRLYVAPVRDSYLIEVYLPDGGLEKTITRAYDSRARTDAEEKRTRAALQPQRFRRGRGGEFTLTIEKDAADIESMQVTAGGELWVLSSRGYHERAAGVLVTYDVFAADGVFVRQVAVMADGAWPRDGFIDLGDGRYLLLKGLDDARRAASGIGGEDADEDIDDAAPLEVICFESVP